LPAKSSRTEYQVQIEKDGYLPVVSDSLSRTSGAQTLTFKLQRGCGPTGVVLLPKGEPALNADVFLCTSQAGVTIDGPGHVQLGVNTTPSRTRTDRAGRFALPAAFAPEGLILIHDQGYAEVSLSELAKHGQAVLQPWGRIEGRLLIDSRAAPGETIVVWGQNARYDEAGRRANFVGFRMETTTDSAGAFFFEKVPPGECAVVCVQKRPGVIVQTCEKRTTVTAGGKAELVLGDSGRTITGRAMLLVGTNTVDWQQAVVQLIEKTDGAIQERPKRADFPSRDAYVEASERYFNRHYCGAFCDPTGIFRMRGVPPGVYELEIRLPDIKSDSVRAADRTVPVPTLASLIREVTVTEIPAGIGTEPLDLGDLPLTPAGTTASTR
jgi:hypothetical protein